MHLTGVTYKFKAKKSFNKPSLDGGIAILHYWTLELINDRTYGSLYEYEFKLSCVLCLAMIPPS